MANKAIEILLKAKDSASAALKTVADHIRQTGDSSKEAAAPINEMGNASERAAEKINAIPRAGVRAADAINELNERNAEAVQRVKDLADAADETEKRTDSMGRSIGRLTARVTAFITAGLGLRKLKQYFTDIIQTGGEFESLKVQLEAVTGSAHEAGRAFDWIINFSENAPYQIDAVSDAFVKLKAFGLDPMDGTLQALVDQTSKLGGSQETLNGLILGVGQAWAKQKLQGEEILQLLERGVPVWDLLGNALGKTSAELSEMSQRGELGRDVIKKLIDEIGSSSMGTAAAKMGLLRGIVSSLTNEFKLFRAQIADAGALEYFKAQLQDIYSRIRDMATDGSLQELAQKISDGMIRGAEAVKSLVNGMIALTGQLKLAAQAYIAMKIGAWAVGFYKAATAVGVATVALRAFTVALARTGIGAVIVGVGYLAAKFMDLGDASDDVVQEYRKQAEEANALREKLNEISERTGIVVETEEQLAEAVKNGNLVLNERTGLYEKARQADQEYEAQLQALGNEIVRLNDATGAAVEQSRAFRARLDELGLGTENFAAALSNLTDVEFAAFSEGAQAAFGSELLTDIEKATLQTDILAESMTRLRLDPETYISGFTSIGRAATQAFKQIVESSESSSELIVDAFEAALSKVGNSRDLEALRETLKGLGSDGRLSAEQLGRALGQIEEAAESLNEKLKEADKTLSELGSEINSAATISALDDIGNAAAMAWYEGKISAEEYLKVMDSVDQKKKQLIETTKQQAAAERELAAASSQGAAEAEKGATRVVAVAQQYSQAMREQAEATAMARDEVNQTDLAHGSGMAGLVRYWKAVEDISRAYLESNKNAKQLVHSVASITNEAGVSAGVLQDYQQQLEAAISNGERLNQQNLSQLQSALSNVKSRIEAITNETKSARSELAGLESELASLQGDQAKQQQIEYERRRLDLQEKINAAQAEGNRDAVESYQKSLSMLSKINQLKMQDIRAEQQAAPARQQSGSTSAAPRSSGTNVAAARTVNLRFQAPDGEAATVQADESDVSRVISILQRSSGVTR